MENNNKAFELGDYLCVKHEDLKTRLSSRSGGVFTALTDIILNEGGRVYGVKLNGDFIALHAHADNFEERDLFRGSKYVQSDKGDTFLSVERDLRDGKKVLFSGTPCEVAGILAFLNAKKVSLDNLITVDIVCHGTPSPKVWRDYLDHIEKVNDKKIKSVDFRNKIDFGWASHTETVYFEDGTRYDSTDFRYLFYRHCILRPSCFNCPFKSKRVADITIGDAWGIQSSHPEFNDDKGVSLVILNTQNGVDLFNKSIDNLSVIAVEPREVWQRPLYESETEPENRKEFWNYYGKKPIKKVIKKYAGDSFYVRIKRRAKKILKRLGIKR